VFKKKGNDDSPGANVWYPSSKKPATWQQHRVCIPGGSEGWIQWFEIGLSPESRFYHYACFCFYRQWGGSKW